MTIRVRVGARLHAGFCNLSLAHDRLYGGIGVAVAEPTTAVSADPAGEVRCDHDRAREYAEEACTLLDVDGAEVTVHESIAVHAGLGSGTALALATLTAIARSHDIAPAVRERAPALGRGGRSGVGVAAFERGGFVLDAGQPTDRFTTTAPAPGEWTVPPVISRHPVPANWRFLLVRPEVPPGRSDGDEDESMRTVIRDADPGPADRIAGLVVRKLLPAIATGDRERFGEAIAAIGRLNGGWYAGEQGGLYRPPVGDLVEALSTDPAISGVGQSSWGPTVYGVTDVEYADAAETAGREALESAGLPGSVRVVAARNGGATVNEDGSGPA